MSLGGGDFPRLELSTSFRLLWVRLIIVIGGHWD